MNFRIFEMKLKRKIILSQVKSVEYSLVSITKIIVYI